MQLPRDEVHCWYVDLDVPSGREAALRETLSGDERSRSARFRFERDRRRFVVAHGTLRVLLGRYLGTRPRRLRFVQGAFGKPALGPASGRRLAFNLSHSAGLAVVAVAHAEVGVDVERIRAQPDCVEIARCCFPDAEVERLNAVPNRLRAEAFFRSWTRNEAYVKAQGKGLSVPSALLPVPPAAGPQGASAGIAPHENWSFHALRPAPGYVGALAVEGSGWRLEERDWPADGAAASPPPRRSPW